MKKKFQLPAAIGLSCLLLLSIDGVRAQVQTARSIQTGPNSYGYYEYLPAGYSTNHAPYPLMVFLSGEWQQGNGTTMLPLVLQYGPPQIIAAGQWPDSFKVDGRTFQFVIISPQFTIWEAETDIDDVINYALAHYNVDPKRVYLTGYSAGGGMTWAYAGYNNAFGNKLAAIVPISAAIGINDQQAHNIAYSNVPVYTTHNIDDSTVPVTFCLANVAAVNHATPPPAIPVIDSIFPARGFGHNAWTETYYAGFLNPAIHNWNIYQWMLHYSRTAPNTVVPNSPDTTSSPPPPPPPPPTPPPPQPVALTAWSATLTANGKAVNVDWTTASEIGNKYFIVQRSADSTTFTNLDTVLSAAKSGGGASYQYTDNAPLTGNSFYRLERVDSAGHDTLYSVLKVSIIPPSPPPPPADTTPPPPPVPQPVALTAYSATLTAGGKAVNVDWSTAKEIGNKYFIVQRSADSITFTGLDTVLSAAKNGGGASYQYTDTAPPAGPDYYRLERVDSTGKDTLYKVLAVQISDPAPPPPPKDVFLLSPNPASGLVNLHLVNAETGELHVSLTDMQGRILRVWVYQKQGAVWDQSVDVAGLPKGAYVLRIQGITTHEVQTILKE